MPDRCIRSIFIPNEPQQLTVRSGFLPKELPLPFTEDNLPIYERCIVAYEGNKLEVKPDGIYINGEKTNEYTFKMDYYWMMGDNRHNSARLPLLGFCTRRSRSGQTDCCMAIA